ncbi:MAG: DUF1971 domain-containing protein [Neisseria sp.]|uniref:DUF1971 domain-containing protein n=1 Tax=Neisseria sp. TaxID=192066 RepID=UPI0026DCD6FA|nr:DUF1971 domain-containing protein [Neisseria sp.]MDO4640664.1 DUF1971 domain-containing protein [Neisseria sp.]
MRHEDCFIAADEMTAYVCTKELPEWTAAQFPQQIAQVGTYARLQVLAGSFRFCAYDGQGNAVYEEIFDTAHQQTLLKPNVRHTAAALSDDTVCRLQLYQAKAT